MPASASSSATVSEAQGLEVLLVWEREEERVPSLGKLAERGHRVVPVSTGDRALREAHLHPPDVLLVTHPLPDMDLFDFLHRIREDLPDLPLVLLVPPGHEDLEVRAIGAGVSQALALSPRVHEFLPRVVEGEVDRVRDRARLERALRDRRASVEEGRRTRQALEESEVRLRLLLSQMPVVLWTVDRNLRFTSGMGAGLSALGLSHGRLRGRPLGEVFGAADGPDTPMSYHRRALAGESTRYEFETNGRWYDVRLEPLRSREGDLEGVLGVAFDATDRKRTVAALGLSEERFRLFAENAQDVIYLFRTRPARSFEFVSPSIAGLTGHALEEFYADPDLLLRLLHPDDRAVLERTLQDPTRPAEPAILRWIRDDGGIVFAEHRIAPLFEDGVLVGLQGVARDVTARRTAEDALKAAEAKFRGLVEHSLVGIYIIQDGRFAYVNPRFAEILGYPSEEILRHRSVEDLVAAEDRPLVRENLRRRMAGEVNALHYSYRALRKDGTIVEVEVRGTRMDYEGRPAVIGSLLDITERKRAEDELRRSESRFRTLFEAAADAIVLLTPKADILDINPAGEALIGARREHLLGRNVTEFLDPGDVAKAQEYLGAVLRGETRADPFEVRFTSVTGRRRVVSLRSRHVREDSAEAYVEMVARDVTEELEMHRRLEATERLASMGQMAAYVAHEVNTPLANIALLTAAAMRRTQDPGLAEKLEKINVQRRNAASIIADLLSFSKQREIQRAEADLRTTLLASVEQVEAYRRPGVEIRIEAPTQLTQAFIDRLQMQEVFVNLLRNALEATSEGSVVLRVEETPTGHRVSVQDTGVGIPKETMDRIFEPFFTTKRKTGGTGLGLVFCLSVVKAHGGEIRAESEPGHGTTFTVVLPREAPHEDPRGG